MLCIIEYSHRSYCSCSRSNVRPTDSGVYQWFLFFSHLQTILWSIWELILFFCPQKALLGKYYQRNGEYEKAKNIYESLLKSKTAQDSFILQIYQGLIRININLSSFQFTFFFSLSFILIKISLLGKRTKRNYAINM